MSSSARLNLSLNLIRKSVSTMLDSRQACASVNLHRSASMVFSSLDCHEPSLDHRSTRVSTPQKEAANQAVGHFGLPSSDSGKLLAIIATLCRVLVYEERVQAVTA